MYFFLNKLYGINWVGKVFTDVGENGIDRLRCRGREFEEIVVCFILDLGNYLK